MRITVNGEPRELPSETSVAGLLESLGIKDSRVAVEVNLEVVRRDDRSSRAIVDGDRIEIVSFVGGGV